MLKSGEPGIITLANLGDLGKWYGIISVTYISRQLLAERRIIPRCTSHRRALTVRRYQVTLKRVKYKRTGNCISWKCERPRRYQPLPCAREREDKSEKREKRGRKHTLPVVEMHQLLIPLPLLLSLSLSCLRRYSSRSVKIIVRRNFHASRARNLSRTFAYDENCSPRMMYGFVARRVQNLRIMAGLTSNFCRHLFYWI